MFKMEELTEEEAHHLSNAMQKMAIIHQREVTDEWIFNCLEVMASDRSTTPANLFKAIRMATRECDRLPLPKHILECLYTMNAQPGGAA